MSPDWVLYRREEHAIKRIIETIVEIELWAADVIKSIVSILNSLNLIIVL